MKNNDFKVICVFNFLISIQLPLKRAQVKVSMTKLNKLYIYRQGWFEARAIGGGYRPIRPIRTKLVIHDQVGHLRPTCLFLTNFFANFDQLVTFNPLLVTFWSLF